MYYYRAFGVNIRSEIALDAVAETDACAAGEWVEIVCRQVPSGVRDLDDGNDLIGTAEGLLRCRISNGTQIVVDALPGADRGLLRSLLIGELMAALLRQRGYLVLHGAAVARDGAAIGFLGNSGWGKSTLASHFTQRGYTFLTDDVLVVDLSGEEPMVIPGPAHVKLNEDVAKLVVEESFDALRPVHGQTRKRLAEHRESELRGSTPLHSLYLLERVARPAPGIDDLSGNSALLELIRHTRAQRLITSPAFQAKHLAQCQTLLRRVRMGVLHRPRSLERLSDVAEAVENDVGRVPAGDEVGGRAAERRRSLRQL